MTETLESAIADKTKYLNDLKFERIARPSPKSAYIALLNQTEQELQELIAQNDAIIEQNRLDKIAENEAIVAAALLKPQPLSIEERIAALEMIALEGA